MSLIVSRSLLQYTLDHPSSPGSKATGALNRSGAGGIGIKGLPLRPDLSKSLPKAGGAAASMDDFAESGRKLVKLGDMPAIDLAVETTGNGIGDLEAEDDDEPESMVVDPPAAVAQPVEEEEEEDPLDAFMSGVKEEVKKVNDEDRKRMVGVGKQVDANGEDGDDNEVEEARDIDELDATDLRPEDILACVH